MIKLTAKQRKFVNTYEEYGGNYALITNELKIGQRMFENYMQQVEVKEYLACAMERTKQSILAALPHIQQELLKMYNCETTDDKIKVMIAKEFMDRCGLLQDKNVNLNVNINTQIADRARQIMIERQSQNTIETTAKPVAERLSGSLGQFSTIEIPPNTTDPDPTPTQGSEQK